MNNIMYGCARAYNAIHQSHILDNVRAVFPNRINTFAGMQCSATRKCKSFAQTLPLGGSGNQTRQEKEMDRSRNWCIIMFDIWLWPSRLMQNLIIITTHNGIP